jgi:hypothetical protein
MVAAGMTGMNFINLVEGSVEMKIIPVDFTVNTVIAAAYKKASNPKDKTLAIFNSTTSTTNPVTWSDFCSQGQKSSREFPLLEKSVFYPNAYVTSSPVLYTLIFVLIQLIPAIIFDAILALSGKKAL